jgi:hypothetical protein
MKAQRKSAIAGVHLELADGMNVFPCVPGEYAWGQTSSACVPTPQSKENDHDEN